MLQDGEQSGWRSTEEGKRNNDDSSVSVLKS